MSGFDEYNTERLRQALSLLNKVHEYNYGTVDKALEKRLVTIINKLHELLGSIDISDE